MKRTLKFVRAIVTIIAFFIGYGIIGSSETGRITAYQCGTKIITLAGLLILFFLATEFVENIIRFVKANKKMTWSDYQSDSKSFNESDYDR